MKYSTRGNNSTRLLEILVLEIRTRNSKFGLETRNSDSKFGHETQNSDSKLEIRTRKSGPQRKKYICFMHILATCSKFVRKIMVKLKEKFKISKKRSSLLFWGTWYSKIRVLEYSIKILEIRVSSNYSNLLLENRVVKYSEMNSTSLTI